MKTTAIFFRIKPEMKKKLQEMAKVERRSVASLILLLIDEKLKEIENATIKTKK